MLIQRKEKKQCKQKFTLSTKTLEFYRNVANFPQSTYSSYVKKPKLKGMENMLKFFKI